jgi:hypothetical protein
MDRTETFPLGSKQPRPCTLTASPMATRGKAFELYLRGPRQELLDALGEWGKPRADDRYALKWASAVAWVGPAGAVLHIPPSASDDEVRQLLEAAGGSARRRGWGVADGSGESLLPGNDAIWERFLRARNAPVKEAEKKRLTFSHSYLLFLVAMVVLGGIGIVVLRVVIGRFLHDAFSPPE